MTDAMHLPVKNMWIAEVFVFAENSSRNVGGAMKDKEQLHQEDLQRIRAFRLMDDDFMNACFDENIEATELVLRIILKKPDLKVIRVSTQKVMKNLLGRDIWLDIDATDSDNTEIDIEIQRADRGAGRKRARYHSSILDAHLLQPSEEFSDLPETYVIFITEKDVIGSGLPIYTVERTILELDQSFNDGGHIIYVNGTNRDAKTELGKLMHDFACREPDDMYYDILAKKARYFKKDEEGVAYMCKALEDMRNEARDEVREENALRMLADGLPIDKVAEYVGLPEERVRELANSKSA